MSNDLNYVNWGNFPDNQARQIEQIFICESSMPTINEYVARGWKIVFMDPFVKDNYDDRNYSYNALLERK
jgi:hypothetical protein